MKIIAGYLLLNKEMIELNIMGLKIIIFMILLLVSSFFGLFLKMRKEGFIHLICYSSGTITIVIVVIDAFLPSSASILDQVVTSLGDQGLKLLAGDKMLKLHISKEDDLGDGVIRQWLETSAACYHLRI